ncbi:cystathionine gamma-synthase [Aliarcobacter cryaerophilus ATCC 43158]|uniref:Cys/Met metabolism PLP-dependent enzyme n=1 Tax=Aliarcobacter cryaerophilus ATCC 43158 TaxID=1032070 RepID=A0AAD0XAN7_9BACT|nr:PLP-dependent transferase [Aliarcobacter cryaerophilus]AYJ80647.1 Cys/Met metabolism PLP-dependent enzyme [Aliarcobacter cryaerophilus ATCC 43158]QCZ22979.1 cystathionine gamma-synthase [Aliarcobacter cryaerophilus ATCC 43158]
MIINSIFKPIYCGKTLPENNIHAVSTSMPTLQDVIDYEEQTPEILEKITVAYPRFIVHPYLKKLAIYLKTKYKVSDKYELILLSSKKAVNVVSSRFYINNPIDIDEDFGVIMVLKGRQYKKVLKFIQHVGYNLSSRLAENYLYNIGIISSIHQEELADETKAKDILISTLSNAYNQPLKNICLSPSGMNAMYCVLKGIKNIQAKNGRTILVQLGWLYLDTMNIINHYFEESKIFHDITNLDSFEEFLKENGLKVSAIVTEIPTNPLIQTVDLEKLKNLCKKYNIPLVIDSTFATPYNLNLDSYADIYVESLTKFACGNADVLMGAIILNENSKISHISQEFFKHCDEPYIKDIQRLALEIKDYKSRVKKISSNTKKLVEYFQKSSYIDKIFYCLSPNYKKNYEKLMIDENSLCGIISLTFKKDFQKVYDSLNFPKGPSLGTEFTLLMPYTYLAHYDLIGSKEGKEFLEKINLPINLLRISVGVENIEEIKKEFDKLNTI